MKRGLTKKILFSSIILICLYGSIFAAESPIIFSAGLSSDTARSEMLAGLFEEHFSKILSISSSFKLINSKDLQKQLFDNKIYEDSAILRFAAQAKIPSVIRGSIVDRGDCLYLTLYSLCYDIPFNGQSIAHYRVEIPLKGAKYSSRELSYIIEEHTGRFLAQLYKEFRYPQSVTIRNGKLQTNKLLQNKKNYKLYQISVHSEQTSHLKQYGEFIYNGKSSAIPTSVKDGNYLVLLSLNSESDFLKEYYYGRKTEMVFNPPSIEETLLTAMATPLIAAISPIASPAAYYISSDFKGLGLWTASNTPYIGIGVYGLLNRPTVLKKEQKDIKQFNKAAYYFGLYYFLGAGASMYADAAGSTASQSASIYNRVDPYMGSSYSALYFSILGSGGGHFYKGYRKWGYLFFHLDNMLLFSSLYYLLDSEQYSDDSYHRVTHDKTYGYISAGAAVLVRAIEIWHCQSLEFNIRNGKSSDSDFALLPILTEDYSGSLIAGLAIERAL